MIAWPYDLSEGNRQVAEKKALDSLNIAFGDATHSLAIVADHHRTVLVRIFLGFANFHHVKF